MNKMGPGNGPDKDGDGSESWTNELLSLGMRRELLAREVQRYVAARQHAQSAKPKPDSPGERRTDGGRPTAGHDSGKQRGG